MKLVLLVRDKRHLDDIVDVASYEVSSRNTIVIVDVVVIVVVAAAIAIIVVVIIL